MRKHPRESGPESTLHSRPHLRGKEDIDLSGAVGTPKKVRFHRPIFWSATEQTTVAGLSRLERLAPPCRFLECICYAYQPRFAITPAGQLFRQVLERTRIPSLINRNGGFSFPCRFLSYRVLTPLVPRRGLFVGLGRGRAQERLGLLGCRVQWY